MENEANKNVGDLEVISITPRGTQTTLRDIKEFLKQPLPTQTSRGVKGCTSLWSGLAHEYIENLVKYISTIRQQSSVKVDDGVLVKALKLLCPNSLRLALAALEGDRYEVDIERARMHISCELERMVEAQSALRSSEMPNGSGKEE